MSSSRPRSELLSRRIPRPGGEVLLLTLQREQACNAITEAQARALEARVLEAEAQEGLRGIVVTAAGSRYFAAGGDLRELSLFPRDARGAARVLGMGEALMSLSRCSLPVAIVVQGLALGGGAELALLGDRLFVEEQAVLAFRQARMGLSTAWGGLARLVERVGGARARELLWSARDLSAQEALDLGLADEVQAPGKGLEAALCWMDALFPQPRAALAANKRALAQSFEALYASTRAAERDAFSALWGGEAHQRAVQTFLARSSASSPPSR